MKKIISVLLILVLLSLTGCAGKTEDAEKPEDKTPVSENVTANDNVNDADETQDEDNTPADTAVMLGAQSSLYEVVLVDGRTVTIGEKADAVLSALGDYTDMFEAPSCIHEGYDRVYSYGSFSVTTSPDSDGNDIVSEFGVETDECVLEGGITIGSSIADIESVYGTDYTESFGFISYDFGGTTASFVTDGSAVTSIAFSNPVE